MAAGKKSSVILWTGVAAATTGVIAVAILVKFRERSLAANSVQHRLSDVQDVLADCYNKISEIEQHLPELMRGEPKNNGQRFSSQPF